MDLNEQANDAVEAVLAEVGVTATNDVTRRLLKMAWFNGYTSGMAAVEAMAESSFARLRAELS